MQTQTHRVDRNVPSNRPIPAPQTLVLLPMADEAEERAWDEIVLARNGRLD